MNTGKSALAASFIAKQRRILLGLRAALTSAAQSERAEVASINTASADSAGEFEDDAQRLAALELDANLVVRDFERLERVNRALEKIEQGTYGFSDLSGKPIPRERLEAVPEAICMLSEEKNLEQKRPQT